MIDINGKTMKRIFLELAQVGGVKSSVAQKNMKRMYALEKDYVKKHGKTYGSIILKGVVPLLKELKKKDYPIGLLTGNSEYTSFFKLKKVGLDGFFNFGGFGEVSENRDKLVDAAIKAANKKFRTRFNKKNVFYFGDAPLDIIAGKKAGVKVIAVATGWCSISELKKYKPNYLLKDLSDTNGVLKILHV